MAGGGNQSDIYLYKCSARSVEPSGPSRPAPASRASRLLARACSLEPARTGAAVRSKSLPARSSLLAQALLCARNRCLLARACPHRRCCALEIAARACLEPHRARVWLHKVRIGLHRARIWLHRARIWLHRAHIWLHRVRMGSHLVVQGLHLAAQGSHLAAQGSHLAAQASHFAAQGSHLAARGCIWLHRARISLRFAFVHRARISLHMARI